MTVTRASAPAARAVGAPPLAARGVVVRYEGRDVLHGVDLELASGQTLALLGANGSGKSTLVRALTGLVPLAAGSVELFGTPRHEFHDWGRVGYVPQRVTATGGVPATVGEVVTSGLVHGWHWRPGRDARSRVAEALGTVGLGDLARRPVATLSGGQQQRVLIARALVRRPELLVLDEPVAGVDRVSQEAFAATLTALSEEGTTTLIVLHELGPLEPLIGRAVVLREGRVVHDGAPPRPHGHHADEDHDHVHPHAHDPDENRWLW